MIKKEIKDQKKKYIIYLRGIKTKKPGIIKQYIWGKNIFKTNIYSYTYTKFEVS